jgi:hypothetical protein
MVDNRNVTYIIEFLKTLIEEKDETIIIAGNFYNDYHILEDDSKIILKIKLPFFLKNSDFYKLFYYNSVNRNKRDVKIKYHNFIINFNIQCNIEDFNMLKKYIPLNNYILHDTAVWEFYRNNIEDEYFFTFLDSLSRPCFKPAKR